MSISTLHLQEDARAALQTLYLVQRYSIGLGRSRISSEGVKEEIGEVAYLNHWYQRWREMQQDRAVKALQELGMEVPAQATVKTDKVQ
jgi:hypothetical protein